MKSFVYVLIHFIDEKEHRYIELDVQSLAQVCQIIEEIGVPTAEMDGDDIAMVLHTL
jgi:hypothetical protein